LRRRIAAAALTAATAVLASGLAITSSSADTDRTWTVTPGGAATARSGVITLTDMTTGKAGTCASSNVTGTLTPGSGLPGNDIGAVTSATFGTCTGPFHVALAVTPRELPWELNFASYDPRTGVTRGTVSHLQVVVSGPCNAIVNGTGGTEPDGVVTGTYTNSTARLTFLPTGGNLHFWHVHGCGSLLNSGDPAALSAAYAIGPRQVITSP
jgi:hypothetical protein